MESSRKSVKDSSKIPHPPPSDSTRQMPPPFQTFSSIEMLQLKSLTFGCQDSLQYHNEFKRSNGLAAPRARGEKRLVSRRSHQVFRGATRPADRETMHLDSIAYSNDSSRQWETVRALQQGTSEFCVRVVWHVFLFSWLHGQNLDQRSIHEQKVESLYCGSTTTCKGWL